MKCLVHSQCILDVSCFLAYPARTAGTRQRPHQECTSQAGTECSCSVRPCPDRTLACTKRMLGDHSRYMIRAHIVGKPGCPFLAQCSHRHSSCMLIALQRPGIFPGHRANMTSRLRLNTTLQRKQSTASIQPAVLRARKDMPSTLSSLSGPLQYRADNWCMRLRQLHLKRSQLRSRGTLWRSGPDILQVGRASC